MNALYEVTSVPDVFETCTVIVYGPPGEATDAGPVSEMWRSPAALELPETARSRPSASAPTVAMRTDR